MDARHGGPRVLTHLVALGALIALQLFGIGPRTAPDPAAAADEPTITLTKAFGADRVEDTDQFSMNIVRDNLIISSGLTTGTGSTVDPGSGTAGPYLATAGTTYELMELALGTADSADYDATIDCVDANGLQTGLPDDEPFDTGGSYAITPVANAAITCTITNTPRAADPTVQVVKQLGAARLADTDEFTVQIEGEPGVLGSSTTAGAGAGIDTGTGDTGPVTIPADALVVVGEVAAGTTDLDRYDATITCVDASELQAGLPDDEPLGPEGIEIEPVAGAVITCTITNSPSWPTIEVVKELGGARVRETDEFTVEIESDATVIASGTTTGEGATVDPGTGTTGVETFGPDTTVLVDESAAGTTALEHYTATVTCVDEEGVAQDLPDGAPLGEAAIAVALPAAAEVTCTITNTPRAPIIEVIKALDGDRDAATDQFTVRVRDGITVLGSATTTGTGATIDPGTGTTGLVTLSPGGTYQVDEIGSGTTDVAEYAPTVTCEDNTELTADLPFDQPLGEAGIEISPSAAAEITCTITNHAPDPSARIEVQKVLGGARLVDTDEFTVQIANDAQVVAESTTTGAGDVVDTGTGEAGLDATPGAAYEVGEVAAGTTDLGDYVATISCVDAAGLQTGLPDDDPLTEPVTIEPVDGADIACEITNTPVATTIEVVKTLGGARIADTDEFTVEIVSDATVIDSGTTAGSGATVDPGTGTTGVYPVTAATAYEVGESEAGTTDLDRYDATIECVDANELQAGLPDGDPYTGPVTIEPTLGAEITCTITNTPAAGSIEVGKALGSDRIADTDEFTVEIVSDATVIDSGTTTGAGSTVDAGTGEAAATFGAGSTVTVGESEAGTTDLDHYTATISCTDEEGYADELPAGDPLGEGVEITLPAGSAVSCTILNTPRPTIRISKSLGTPRVEDGDQFRVVVVTEDLTVVAGSTTTGSGDTVDPGTGDTGAYRATAGVTYEVGELAVGTTNLSRYEALLSCSDANGVQPGLPISAPYVGPVAFTPVAGAEIVCSIENRAAPATIVVDAAFGTDRAQPGDQLTVGISQPGAEQQAARIAPGPDGPIVSDPTNATTAGTGSTVEPGTGTTGLYVASAGVTYGIGEQAAGTTDLEAYTATLTCVDAAGFQPGLPTDAAHTGTFEITPVAGARITCTFTNRVSTAVVEDASITKELVSSTPVGTAGYDVHYRLTVENIGSVAMTYDLDDTLLFGAGVTVTAATVANTTPGDVPVVAGWDGRAQPRVATAEPIAVGEVHVFDVTVRVTVEATATAASIDCAVDPGETGTGTTNSATLGSATTDAEATVAVCGAVAPRDPGSVGPVPPVVGTTSPGTGPLARTGAAIGLLVAVGLSLLVAGSVLGGGRRRHRLPSSIDPSP
ncbi:MAG TPA: hypothetical protein VF228_06075 [Iamia sp.]